MNEKNLIRINNITKIYRTKTGKFKKALNNISLSFKNKGMYFIVGESGSGKSTLLNLIGSLDSFDQGDLFFRDKSIKMLNRKEQNNYRNNNIGFIFQDYNLINELTVYDNIAITLELAGNNNMDRIIMNILTNVNMENHKDKFPSELSGGELQRVSIARAIAKNPSIILADEPTGSLDERNEFQIIDILKEISKTRLVIIVSHNKKLANIYGDTIVQIEEGTIKDLECKNINKDVEFKTGTSDNRANISRKNIFKIALSFLNNRKLKLLLSVILASVSFSLFTITFAMTSYNSGKTGSLSVKNSNIDYVNITRYIMDDQGISSESKFNQDFINSLNFNFKNLNFKPVYSSSPIGEFMNFRTSINRQNFSHNLSLYPLISGFYEFNNDDLLDTNFEMVNGNFPNKDDELVITLKTFNIFKALGYKNENIENYEDIIGKTINLVNNFENLEFKVVGILDTKNDFNKYDKLNNLDKLSISEQKLQKEYEDVLFNGFHSLGYVSHGFIDKKLSSTYFPSNENKGHRISNKNKRYTSFTNINSYKLIDNENDILYFGDYKNSYISENDIVISSESYINSIIEKNKEEFKKFIFEYLIDVDKYLLAELLNSNNITNSLKVDELVFMFDYYIDLIYDTFYSNINLNNNYNYPENIMNMKSIIAQYLKRIFINKNSYSETISEVFWNNETNTEESTNLNYNVVGIIIPEVGDLSTNIYISKKTFDSIKSNENHYNYTLSFLDNSSNKSITDLEAIINKDFSRNDSIQIRFNNYVVKELHSISSTLKEISNVTIYLSIILLIFLILVLSTYLSNNIIDKKHQIGILKSLGTPSSNITKIFLVQALIVSVLSYFISLILSIIAVSILNSILKEKFYIVIKILNISLIDNIFTLCIVLFISIFTTIVVTNKLYKINAIDAIKNK